MASSVENKKASQSHQTREDYKKREADLKRKHNNEINTLQKTHASQIRELQANQQEQLEGVRMKSQESLSTQDKKYQSEIEKMRYAHKQQNINAAQEQESKMKELQSIYEGQMNKEASVSKGREESLEKNYMRTFKEKEEEYNKSVDYMREKQAEAIIDERNRLENKYAKDGNSLRKVQDDKVHDLSQELQNIKEQKNAEIVGLETRLISDKEEAEAEKMDLLMQERKQSAQKIKYMNDEYHNNLDKLREKYQEYSIDSKSGRMEELQNLEANASKRSRETQEALERRIRSMKADHDMETFEKNNEFRLEKKAYLEEAKKQSDVSDLQREKVYEVANERTKKEINDIVKRNNDSLDRQNKHYQGRIQEMNDKYNESIETQVHRLELDSKSDAKASDLRQKKVVHLLQKEKNSIESYYQELIDENNKQHQQDLFDQRAILTKEKNEAIRNMENRMREIESKNGEKMNMLALKYEQEILNLKEMQKADSKSLVTQYTKRIDELERNQKMLVETSKIQSENKEKQLRDKYDKQIEGMRMAHEEEKIKLASKKI